MPHYVGVFNGFHIRRMFRVGDVLAIFESFELFFNNGPEVCFIYLHFKSLGRRALEKCGFSCFKYGKKLLLLYNL